MLPSGTSLPSGAIVGGTINDTGGGLAAAGGILDGVTYDGPLDLSAIYASLVIADGITLKGAGGIGPGTANLTGNGSYLYIEDTTTLDNAVVNIGSTDYVGHPTLYAYDTTGNGKVLTLGPQLNVVLAGAYGELTSSANAGDGIVNKGTITAAFNGGQLIISSRSFTNQGTMVASNGGLLDLQSNLSNTQLGKFSTDSGGVLALTGTLSNGAQTLNLGTGAQLMLASGGKISGGTINDTGGGLIADQGLLNAVTYDAGVLDLSATNAGLYVTKGMAVKGAGGVGPGVIGDTGNGSFLAFIDTQTALNNVTVDLGNDAGSSYLTFEADIATAQTWTLGSGTSITQVGSNATILLDGDYQNVGGTLVNVGTVNAGLNGATLRIEDYHQFLVGYPSGAFTNKGKLVASNGGTLLLQTNISAGGLGVISTSGGGVVELAGGFTINNTGATVNLSGAAQLTLAGTIAGGTVKDTGGGLIGAGGVLNGVTCSGTLNLNAADASLTAMGGLTGAGTAVINITGQNAVLFLDDTQALNSATVNLGNNAANAYLEFEANTGTAQTWTLGSYAAINQTGANARIYLDSSYNAGTRGVLINQGTVTAGLSGATLDVVDQWGGTLTNQGKLIAKNGGELNLGGVPLEGLPGIVTLINYSGSTLTGGSWEADTGSTLELSNNLAIVTDKANITLSGTGSTIQSYNTTTSAEVTLDQTLTAIGAGGALNLLAGRNFSTAANFTDNGVLQLGASRSRPSR